MLLSALFQCRIEYERGWNFYFMRKSLVVRLAITFGICFVGGFAFYLESHPNRLNELLGTNGLRMREHFAKQYLGERGGCVRP